MTLAGTVSTPININFKTSEALKASCERALKQHPAMDGRMTSFLEDCMRQFVIQMRNKESQPAFPLEFVTNGATTEPARAAKKRKAPTKASGAPTGMHPHH